MNHRVLDYHTDNCLCKTHPELAINKKLEEFMFYINGKFWLISHCRCMEELSGDPFSTRIAFKEYIIKSLVKKYISKSYWDVSRGHKYTKSFLHERLKRYSNRQVINEINLIYDSSGSKYAIVSKRKFSEGLINISDIEANMMKARKFLKETGRDELISELFNLKEANDFEKFNLSESYTTIESLISNINKLCRQ